MLKPKPVCNVRYFLYLVMVALFAACPLPTLGSEGHEHEAPLAFEVRSLDDAVNAVAFFTGEVESHVASGSLDKIHQSAFAARDAATSATPYFDGLPEEARQELPLLLRRIEAVAIQLDAHGDAGRALESAAYAKRLREHSDTLQRLTGITPRPDWKPSFLTPVHHASKCPHKANHGGRFTLALQDEYHIEGSYPAAGEFRLHFYDKESCPLPADVFSGFVLVGEGEQKIALTKAADGSHLLAALPAGSQLPLHITAIVKLPHPHTGTVITEHFSYNFYKFSSPPSTVSATHPQAH